MQNLFVKIINKFYSKNKFQFYFLIFLSVFAGMFEYIGLVLIFQFILFLNNPNSIYCKKILTLFENCFHIYDFNRIGLFLGIGIASIYILKNIYMLLFSKFNNKILEDLSIQITLKTFKNLLFAPYLTTKNLSEADKINIISKITLAVFQYCYKFINLITNSIISIILVIYLFTKFTKVAFIALLFLFVLAILEYIYLKKRSKIQNQNYTTALENANKILLTIINSILEIKLNNKEEFFLKKSEKEYKKLSILNKDRNFNTVIHIYFTEISIMLGFIVILVALFFTTNFNNQLLISSLCTICVVILRLTPLLNRIQSSIYALNSNKQAVIDLIEFDDNFKNLKINSTKEKLPFNSSIKLVDVDFSYENEKGLKNVNLEIKKNDFIHIIGKSGSYKTTLALILAGLIKPTEGEILIDNKNLIDEKKWQNNIAFLSCDFTFLAEKVDEIIDFSDFNTKKLINTLELSSIKNKNPKDLSSGEKQRLALVDILAKDKNIIILDEATANIDISSQKKIIEILNNLKNKKTIISITHRLENINDEDKTVFITDDTVFCDKFKNLKESILFKKFFS